MPNTTLPLLLPSGKIPRYLPAYVPSSLTQIMSVSGGLSSAYGLKLCLDKYDKVDAVFADTKGSGKSHFWSDLPIVDELLHERFGGEIPDLYRFLWQLSYALNIPIERLEDGRSIWAVAGQSKMFRLNVGGRFFCKASEQLKRETIARYIEAKYKPGTYRIGLGMGVLEPHRLKNAQGYWRWRLGWDVDVFSPVIDHYYQTGHAVENCEMMAWALSLGMDVSSSYTDGFSHDNCSGACFNAAQTHYALLHKVRPLHYAYAAWQEQRVPKMCGFNGTILKDERGGQTRKMSLYQFEERLAVGDVNLRETTSPCACNTYIPMVEFLAQIPTKEAA